MSSLAAGPSGAPLRRLAAPCYAIGLLLVVSPALDYVTSIYPFLPGEAKWRFASLTLLSGFLLTPLLGLALILLAAGLLQHRGALRVTGVLAIVLALAVLAVSGLLALDVVELRATSPAEMRTAIALSGLRGLAKNVLAAAVLFWAGVASLRAAGVAASSRQKQERLEPIVGRA